MIDFAMKKFFGNYERQELIGVGGFAYVYKGMHIWLKTSVAIKVIDIYIDPFDTESARLSLLEALVANSFRHPHIIPILDCNIEDGIPYIVIPYLKNGSLQNVHGKGTQLPKSTIIEYVRQIAEALDFLHAHGVVHQDVKPENMLLADNGNLFLSDFGTVAFIQNTDSHDQRRFVGTIEYMAPERYTDDDPTFASDIYSLAAVVFKWLTGEPLFTGSPTEMIRKHRFVIPSTRRMIALGIEPAIQHVLLKALAKNPQHRYQSVLEFYNALRDAISKTDQEPTPSGEYLSKWINMTIILIVSMLISILVSAVWYLLKNNVASSMIILQLALLISSILGTFINKNWLTLCFVFISLIIAVIIGSIVQSLIVFCFALPSLLLISAFIGFLKGYRS